ncbi:MAG: DUF2752 domain-containing protein [Actinobacteria bacterium]|nr:DUF2752 domain-containing protein [Actinomycetota bacterium]MCG2800150.1 DUF2752 domain-containing protein [Cellulomonas sp.]
MDGMPTADSPATASSPQGAPRLRWEPTDRYAAFTYIAVGGVLASSALAIWGLPVLDLHGPLHRLGIMDFLCGGTRAAYFTTRGRWAMAWYYNPLGPLAVIGAAVMTLRAGVGLATRRWLAVEGGFRGRSRAVLVAGCVAAVALTVRQQLLVDVLL